MTELMDQAREKGLKTDSGRAYHTEFHKRLVLPVGCFFLSLLGMPLGLQAGPGRRAIGIPFGLTLYITYYIMFTMSRNLATGGALPVPLIMWLPNTLLCFLAIIAIHRVAHEQPLVSPYIQQIFEKIVTGIVELFRKGYSLIRSDRSKDEDAEAAKELAQNKILRGNARTRIFHFPECDYYYSQDCSVEFKDSRVALKAGFDPCMFCRTILIDKQTEERQSEQGGKTE